ncbi:MAG TPA: cytochrome P450 [Propionibacteriaceae bacterium]|nr:cytochrome P450 [Propionibacteriaceae bacterium]
MAAGTSARTSVLDDRAGRMRARFVLGMDWLVVNALAGAGDPMARVLSGSPRTDVYADYERIRARGDLAAWRLGVHSVVSREKAEEILRDPRFGVQPTAELTPSRFDLAQGPLSGSFLELDPPRHTRLRRLTAPAFRPRLIRDFTPVVEQVLTEVLDRLEGRDRFDLMTDLADVFPIAVISRLLGIPEADAGHFSRIGALVGQSLDGVRTVRQAQQLRAASRELAVLFRRLADERRREPQDDVISLLATAEAGGELTAEDLVATCGLLLVAGFETTVNLIGNAVVALHAEPEAWSRLVADPGLAEAAAEEALRFEPPVQLTVRFAREDVELDGHRLPRATVLAVLLAAANRDPAAYADPGRFRLDRQGEPEHLAFSSGIHYCLGAPLARLEGPLALRALAERWPDLTLLPGARRRTGTTIRGYASLPVGTSRTTVPKR